MQLWIATVRVPRQLPGSVQTGGRHADDGEAMDGTRRDSRRGPLATLAASLGVVALVTLVPSGAGWSYAEPLAELRWYATGLDSTSTVVQLVGNIGLLVVPVALAVALWPRLGRADVLVPLAVLAGTTIELLQWWLPLGRVVSPLDAVLNATGAVVAGLLVASVRRLRAPTTV
jgi:hypothetical protein